MEFIYQGNDGYQDFAYRFEPTEQQQIEAFAYATLILDGKTINEDELQTRIKTVKDKDLINEECFLDNYDRDDLYNIMKDYLWRFI